MRDSGNVNGLRDLIDTLDTGFVNFYGHRFGTGKENVIQDIGMRVSREKRSGNMHGIGIPLSRPYITG